MSLKILEECNNEIPISVISKLLESILNRKCEDETDGENRSNRNFRIL